MYIEQLRGQRPRSAARVLLAAGAAMTAAVIATADTAHAQYEAPTTYYAAATGTGATLQTQLRTIIGTGVIGRTYGDARDSAAFTDTDPNNSNNILLVYNRASVSKVWDGGITWNREHTWPDSRLGAGNNDPSNSYVGPASDQFELRPANPSQNSSRGNSPYGPDNGSGLAGFQSGIWYPGDADAGDVVRGMFYMTTRYSTLSLADTTAPTGTQMGDLSSLLRFHFKDVPDTFERRRNHAVYGLQGDANSPAITNPFRQQNRNPYIDHPEYVWSVFVNQTNDSQITASTSNVPLGKVIVGAPVPAAQNVTLNKAGLNGTYYSVTAGGAASSTVTGRNNAFKTDQTDSRVVGVGLSTTTATAGQRTGTVTVDNLDITTGGGAGRGANDVNDVINVSLDVLDHSNASFSTIADQNSVTIPFGTIQQGTGVHTLPFSIANLTSTAGFTADLDLDTFSGSGSTSTLSANLAAFSGLDAGTSNSYLASLTTTTPGTFSTTYTINLSDENIAGASGSTISLTLTGTVSPVPEPASALTLLMGGGGFALLARSRRRQRPGDPTA